MTVVPVTSNIAQIHPFQVLLTAQDTGLRLDSKVQVEQLRSVAVERVGSLIGRVPFDLIVQIDNAMRLHIDL